MSQNKKRKIIAIEDCFDKLSKVGIKFVGAEEEAKLSCLNRKTRVSFSHVNLDGENCVWESNVNLN